VGLLRNVKLKHISDGRESQELLAGRCLSLKEDFVVLLKLSEFGSLIECFCDLFVVLIFMLVAASCKFYGGSNSHEDEGQPYNDPEDDGAGRHGRGLRVVIHGGLVIVNDQVFFSELLSGSALPSDSSGITLDEIFSVVPNLRLGTLLREAKAHPGAKPVSILADASSGELDASSVVASDCGKDILTVSGIRQT
jgi:hypothetical protein